MIKANMTYRETVEELKFLEINQKFDKLLKRVRIKRKKSTSELDRKLNNRKVIIKILLSLIDAHKSARRLFHQLLVEKKMMIKSVEYCNIIVADLEARLESK